MISVNESTHLAGLILAALLACATANALAQVSSPNQAASDPALVAAELRQAASLLQLGKPEEAEPILRRVVLHTPGNSDAHNLLGIILDQRQQFKEAEQQYRDALRLNESSISPRANLGVLLVRTGRSEEAIKAFESVLQLSPHHPQATVNLGLQYVARGDYARAVPLLEQAIKLGFASYDIRLNLGSALYQLKRYDEAVASLESASTLSPDSPEPFYQLGLIASARGQDEMAGELWGKAVALRPDFSAANFMLGELSAKRKDFSTAKNYYEKALRQDAEKAVNYIRLGGAYLYLHDFNRAFEIFKTASERFPQVPEVHYFLSIASRARGDSDQSLNSLKRALAINPNYADALALFGAILLDKDDLAGADKSFRKAILANSNNYNANYNLGRLLVKQQNYTEALPLLQRASKVLPENAEVHYQLFLAYSRLNRKADAQQELETFKRLSVKDKK